MMFLAIIGALNPFELTAIYTLFFAQVKPGTESFYLSPALPSPVGP